MCSVRIRLVRLVAVRLALLVAVCALPSALAANARQPGDAIRFSLIDDYLIVVPVMVNGEGPFRFLLDTGTTSSMIDPDLERELNATEIGGSDLALMSGERRDWRVRLDEVRVGQVAVSGLGALVDRLDAARALVPGVRGILGEDFLKQFDIFIDYEKHRLSFDEFAPAGDRCRFVDMGEYRGQPTVNRVLIKVKFLGASNGDVMLQLDTAVKMPELFPASHVSLPHPWDGYEGGSDSNRTLQHMHIAMKIGATEVQGWNLVLARDEVASDAAGLLPASIFRRIYISHSGGFVILNPRNERFEQPRRDEREEAEMVAMGAQ
jgi:predicted aspartyl protease